VITIRATLRCVEIVRRHEEHKLVIKLIATREDEACTTAFYISSLSLPPVKPPNAE